MKQHFKIISTVAVALVILSGVILLFIEISCGLDIFKIGDLAEHIGYHNIDHVTVDGDYIDIKLKESVLLDGDYGVEGDIDKIKKLNAYINSNERYKGMRIKVQYGERYEPKKLFDDTKMAITVANYSLAGKSDELYDGLYSVEFFYYPTGYDFDYITDEFWKDVRELQYINSNFPDDVEPLSALTKLEYLYFERWQYEETSELLKECLPRCEIECDIPSSANPTEAEKRIGEENQ